MFRRPRQLQLQAEHSCEQIIPIKVKGVKLLHAFLAKLAVLQEGRWCDPIQGTCWYATGILVEARSDSCTVPLHSFAHSAEFRSPQGLRNTGTCLDFTHPRVLLQSLSPWGSVQTSNSSPFLSGWAQADQLLLSSSSLMIKIFTAQWVGLAAAPKLCSW